MFPYVNVSGQAICFEIDECFQSLSFRFWAELLFKSSKMSFLWFLDKKSVFYPFMTIFDPVVDLKSVIWTFNRSSTSKAHCYLWKSSDVPISSTCNGSLLILSSSWTDKQDIVYFSAILSSVSKSNQMVIPSSSFVAGKIMVMGSDASWGKREYLFAFLLSFSHSRGNYCKLWCIPLMIW